MATEVLAVLFDLFEYFVADNFGDVGYFEFPLLLQRFADLLFEFFAVSSLTLLLLLFEEDLI